MALKVYTAEFVGHYPVGTAAVVVARDKRTARRVLLAALKDAGVPQKSPDDVDLERLDLRDGNVAIIQDGNY